MLNIFINIINTFKIKIRIKLKYFISLKYQYQIKIMTTVEEWGWFIREDIPYIDSLSNKVSHKVKTGKFYNVLDPKLKDFEMALQRLLLNLAKQIVSDGEGAKKFITVKVINARSQQMARTVAFSIANSPLFKTAMAGEDPNWGRIIMAIGKSGEKITPEKIEIKFGELKVAEKGKISEEYNEEKLKEYMKWDDLLIEVNLKIGQGSFECYTCDLTNEYININADYRN